jgi:protein-disulfide isomerase
VGKNVERTLIALNTLTLGVVLVLALRPGGLLRVTFDTWQTNRAIERTLASEWDTMIASGSRLDRSPSKAVLVEFSDYQCPFCKKAHHAIDSLIRENGELGIVYRHFPLPSHQSAAGAARASVCAANQGRFREMDRRLFETTQWQTDTQWVREARAVRVPDISLFRACLTSQATADRVALDMALARRLRIAGTPMFVARSGLVLGAQPKEALLALLAR